MGQMNSIRQVPSGNGDCGDRLIRYGRHGFQGLLEQVGCGCDGHFCRLSGHCYDAAELNAVTLPTFGTSGLYAALGWAALYPFCISVKYLPTAHS